MPHGQDKKKRTGTVVGELKSRKDAPNKINVLVEILAAGEEKARQYRVAYDPKVKGPMPEVLKAVKAAADRARADRLGRGGRLQYHRNSNPEKESRQKISGLIAAHARAVRLT